jgi:hypothetical protein
MSIASGSAGREIASARVFVELGPLDLEDVHHAGVNALFR